MGNLFNQGNSHTRLLNERGVSYSSSDCSLLSMSSCPPMFKYLSDNQVALHK
jgi:hypothetical protein